MVRSVTYRLGPGSRGQRPSAGGFRAVDTLRRYRTLGPPRAGGGVCLVVDNLYRPKIVPTSADLILRRRAKRV